MRRRDLVVVSTAALALGSIRTLQAQTTAPSTPPSTAPTTTPTTTPSPPPGAAPTSTASTSAASGSQPFTAAQLDQLLAPIALYPDDLLAQTLMAASYPLEVVEAARWSKDNPSLKGAAALAAVKDKGWDVSVTSLVAFPQVLAMMNSQLDWTQKIGDAMIAQQSDVAASIQRLRAQAQAAGNLKTTAQQTVTQQPASAGAPAGTPPAIVIQPANPDTVYVPAYNPNWAYGSWPYADYPPSYFPPTGYGWGGYYGGSGWSSGFSFGLGFAVGGAFFGGWSWGGGWGGGWGWRGWGGWGHNSYTTIDANRATYITNNFNRNYYHDDHWNHDPAHRHGVPYRDQASRERYDQHHPDAAQRQAFRGKLDQGTGDRRDDGNRGNDNRGNENRGNQNRGNEGRDNQNRGDEGRRDGLRGNDWRGDENHGGVHRSAFHGVNHGHEVQRESARGHSYAHHASYHPRGGGGGRGGGGHGGGHGGRR
ncbi:MAG: hypothetical protein QOE02_564 [Rhodospirillaceae bacterium]|nr:hypothetical protein [Rhodospirillaceae bacterium]